MRIVARIPRKAKKGKPKKKYTYVYISKQNKKYVTCYVSHVKCHLSPAFQLSIAMLVKTVFMLKPLDAMKPQRKKTFEKILHTGDTESLYVCVHKHQYQISNKTRRRENGYVSCVTFDV